MEIVGDGHCFLWLWTMKKDKFYLMFVPSRHPSRKWKRISGDGAKKSREIPYSGLAQPYGAYVVGEGELIGKAKQRLGNMKGPLGRKEAVGVWKCSGRPTTLVSPLNYLAKGLHMEARKQRDGSQRQG